MHKFRKENEKVNLTFGKYIHYRTFVAKRDRVPQALMVCQSRPLSQRTDRARWTFHDVQYNTIPRIERYLPVAMTIGSSIRSQLR